MMIADENWTVVGSAILSVAAGDPIESSGRPGSVACRRQRLAGVVIDGHLRSVAAGCRIAGSKFRLIG